MVRLNASNVLLKPSHRRQLMSWLKRPMRLGNRLGDCDITLTLARNGKQFDARANVQDARGSFDCHARNHDWRIATRALARSIANKIHDQCVNSTC